MFAKPSEIGHTMLNSHRMKQEQRIETEDKFYTISSVTHSEEDTIQRLNKTG